MSEKTETMFEFENNYFKIQNNYSEIDYIEGGYIRLDDGALFDFGEKISDEIIEISEIEYIRGY